MSRKILVGSLVFFNEPEEEIPKIGNINMKNGKFVLNPDYIEENEVM